MRRSSSIGFEGEEGWGEEAGTFVVKGGPELGLN